MVNDRYHRKAYFLAIAPFLYPMTATVLLFCMLIINDSFSLHDHRENSTSGFYFQISAILPLQGLSGERQQKKCQVIRDCQAVECQAQLGQCQGAAEGWTLLQHLPAVDSHSPSPLKKVHEFTVSSRDVTNQTPPGQE
jgi:hypothetical protein